MNTASSGRSARDGRVAEWLPLTRSDLELQLSVLPLYIAGLFLVGQLAWNVSTPTNLDRGGLIKGHDFLHFYTLGRVALEGDVRTLYDFDALTRAMWRAVPESRPDAFQPLYAPHVALAFAPLARLPYQAAVYCWMAITVLVYVGCCAAVIRLYPTLRSTAMTTWALLLLFPGFNVLLAAGQTSALALAAITAGFVWFVRGREGSAGVALGLLAYKPPLAIGFAVLAIAGGNWRLLAGMACAAAAQAGVALAWAGEAGMSGYARALSGPATKMEIHVALPEQLHSIAGFTRLLLGSGGMATGAYVIGAVAVLYFAARLWRSDAARERRFAAAVLASLLVAPHLYVYDLVLLMPVLATAWAGARAPGHARGLALWTVWAGWLTPLLGPLALVTRLQLSLPVFLMLLVQLARRGPVPRTTDNRVDTF